MYNGDNERQEFSDWHRYGRERGWFDRATDEFRSWFGDEDAERRRRMDEMERGRPGSNWGMRGRGEREDFETPGWQRRDYSGPSPRGSELEERGRYGMELEGRQRRRSFRDFEDDDIGYGGGGRGRYGERMYGNSMFGRRSYEEENERPRGMFGGEYRGGFFNRDREDRGGFFNREREDRGLFGGMHSGRGPRNYQRSDERISDEVHQVLTFHPEIDASDMEVLVDKGIVTLRGKVENRRIKRLAEDAIEDVYGVREIRNELHTENGLLNRSEEGNSQKRNLLNR